MSAPCQKLGHHRRQRIWSESLSTNGTRLLDSQGAATLQITSCSILYVVVVPQQSGEIADWENHTQQEPAALLCKVDGAAGLLNSKRSTSTLLPTVPSSWARMVGLNQLSTRRFANGGSGEWSLSAAASQTYRVIAGMCTCRLQCASSCTGKRWQTTYCD